MAEKVIFTHLDKIFFPELGITKGDLINYYREVADFILPNIKNRPHNLLRQPGGISGQSFFQKDVDHTPPDFIKTVKIHSESTDEDVHYLVVKDLNALLYMVQLGCIEINPWSSRVGKLDKPDWVIIDLDPEDVGFDTVIKVAKVVHQACEELEMPSYPKTSGKSGIHILIPTGTKCKYEKVRELAHSLAREVNRREPKMTSIERLPAKRQGKVYIDYLQNGQGQTIAAPYSVRPTKEATVSAPLNWDEVRSGLDPKKFVLKNVQKRLEKVGDLWKPVLGPGIDIKQILKKLN